MEGQEFQFIKLSYVPSDGAKSHSTFREILSPRLRPWFSAQVSKKVSSWVLGVTADIFVPWVEKAAASDASRSHNKSTNPLLEKHSIISCDIIQNMNVSQGKLEMIIYDLNSHSPHIKPTLILEKNFPFQGDALFFFFTRNSNVPQLF